MSDLELAIEPIAQFTLNHDDPYSRLALDRVMGAALDAYDIRHHAARHHEEQDERTAHQEALYAALAAVGRAYAASALHQAAAVLIDVLDEETFMALGDTAAALDLNVVEDLNGANGTGEDDEGPEVRVFHGADGWVFSFEPGTQPCTINRIPEGRQDCTDAAVWKVVENHGMHLTIGTWCDGHLPDEHRHLAPRSDS
ncbi:hypothetical protein [Streptomyces sp. T028]|uniref:hypothetical protein n=1 Tax=Streptomyces sp. T028 TaxID=3394379 RepID=UPI003A837790